MGSVFFDSLSDLEAGGAEAGGTAAKFQLLSFTSLSLTIHEYSCIFTHPTHPTLDPPKALLSASKTCVGPTWSKQEAVNINQSLFVLRRVITALSRSGRDEPLGWTTEAQEDQRAGLLKRGV